MNDINRSIFLGRIGNDLELKTSKDYRYSKVRLVTSKRVKNKSNKEEYWHSLIFWGSVAENAVKNLRRGDTIYVEAEHVSRKILHEGIEKEISEFAVEKFSLVLPGMKREEAIQRTVKLSKEEQNVLVNADLGSID